VQNVEMCFELLPKGRHFFNVTAGVSLHQYDGDSDFLPLDRQMSVSWNIAWYWCMYARFYFPYVYIYGTRLQYCNIFSFYCKIELSTV